MALRILVVSIFLAFGSVSPSLAQAAVKRQIDIPQQQLGSALAELAKQTRIQVVYSTDLVSGRNSRPLKGLMTPEEALGKLLSETGLRFEFLDAQTVTLSREGGSSVPPSTPSGPETPAPRASDDSNGAHSPAKEGKKSSSDGFRMAQVDQGTNSQSSIIGNNALATQDTSRKVQIEEIVVTAQKREERLQDVPVPVTAISAQTLLDTNQLRLQDYYSSVPGLTLTPAGLSGAPTLAIRGVTTGGYTNPTVGIVVDDVPYGPSTSLGGGPDVPDFDPGDLARVEVLRGPQGTLYGADSMGGLLKFVTVDPSTDAVSGRLQAGSSSVRNGAELGYNVRGAVNVPLSDTLAVRASAFTRRDAGYIDNVETGQRGVNKTDVDGGRLSALWRPSQAFSLKLSALYQQSKAPGSSEAYLEPGLSDLQQSAPRGSGAYDKNMQAYSAIATAKLGGVDVVALTGYNVNSLSDSIDFTPILGQLTESQFGVPGTVLLENNRTNKFTQEIRLSAPIGEKFDWLLGAFYTHERNQYVAREYAEVASTGAIVGTWQTSDSFPTTYEEYAGFTDLTVHVTRQFDLQFGARESQNRQTYTETIIGPAASIAVLYPGLSSPIVNPEVATKDSSFTYLVTPRFKISPDLMVYARLASGYRAGGPNPTSTIYNLPPSYKPDKTKNYEIGVKGEALDHFVTFDASIYYIDWKDIQLFLIEPVSGAGYYANASRAKSQGLELSLESRPLTGLTCSAWVAWNDAVLTEGFPAASPAYGVRGDRLPNSSRFSGNLSVQQEFPIGNQITAFVGATLSYVGNRQGVFNSPPPVVPLRQDFPAYAKTDLHAGLTYGPWSTNVFVTNVADRRGLIGGGLGTYQPIGIVYIQPRTAGLSVSRTF